MGKLDHGTMWIVCQTLPLSTPRTPRHVNMPPLTRREDFGQDGVESLYRCSVCHTHWFYQQDRRHACLGFKLWPADLKSYRAQDRTLRATLHRVAPQKLFRGPVDLN